MKTWGRRFKGTAEAVQIQRMKDEVSWEEDLGKEYLLGLHSDLLAS